MGPQSAPPEPRKAPSTAPGWRLPRPMPAPEPALAREPATAGPPTLQSLHTLAAVRPHTRKIPLPKAGEGARESLPSLPDHDMAFTSCQAFQAEGALYASTLTGWWPASWESGELQTPLVHHQLSTAFTRR